MRHLIFTVLPCVALVLTAPWAARSADQSTATAAAPAAAPPPAVSKPSQIEVDRVEGQAVHFAIPEGSSRLDPLKIQLHKAQPVGWLRSGTPIPYLLLSGQDCAEDSCDSRRSLHLVRADGRSPLSLVYPGKIINPEDGKPAYEGRLFYGHCLAGRGDLVVRFQGDRVSSKRTALRTSVYLAEVKGDELRDELLSRRLPSIQNTLRLVKRGECHEVPGITRRSAENGRISPIPGRRVSEFPGE